MNVELIACTRPITLPDANPLSVVERAACVCYDSEPSPEYRITKSCKASGHLSVLEHMNFTFHISGVSRALLAQLTRHRHMSFSVRSQRYCSESNFDYVNPFEKDAVKDAMFALDIAEIAHAYRSFLRQGVKPEDARMVLPNACCTELYLTANARALIEASHLRLCSRAQKEIRDMFKAMKDAVAPVCPEVAEWMTPKCETDPLHPFCPERKSCGRHPKLEEVYKK